jgi:hypothetical protein
MITRLYGQFLLSCDKNGIFTPNLRLKYQQSLFRPRSVKKHMQTCAKSLKDNDNGFGVALCDDYCAHFNPVIFNRMFEGGFRKVLGFRLWAEKILSKKMALDPRLSVKADLNFMGRILEGANANVTNTTNHTAPVNRTNETEQVLINKEQLTFREINAKYNTFFMRPITYKFDEDTSIKKMCCKKRTLFITSKTNLYDLKHFTTFVAKQGINFYKYGLQ